jgi:hypothetical protein
MTTKQAKPSVERMVRPLPQRLCRWALSRLGHTRAPCATARTGSWPSQARLDGALGPSALDHPCRWSVSARAGLAFTCGSRHLVAAVHPCVPRTSCADANLVLGRILPQFFPAIFGPGEDEPLDAEGARWAPAQRAA